MWIYSALIAAFLNALMDFFVKVSSGKIQNALGGMLLTVTAALTMVGIALVTRNKTEPINATWMGILYSILAGFSVGIATLFIYKMFDNNTNLSVASPFLRISIVLFSVLLGVIILRESLNVRLLLGVTVSLFGIYLILGAH